ncbi:MAG: nucleotidyltransferase family protein, partial [Clostridiales bacterium]|nr:nucleotidyltransferase family protein [Clostridiales bacterium]
MIVAVIAEYNPFHNGHLYHINKARQLNGAEYIIAIMSGNYVQRGEPAIFDKYLRTKAALINGADLVIELPLYYASSSAEYFAKCSVKTLEKTNLIDKLFFGSESGNIGHLAETATFIMNEGEEYKLQLKKALSRGESFPKSRNIAVNTIIGNNTKILNTPNNIL